MPTRTSFHGMGIDVISGLNCCRHVRRLVNYYREEIPIPLVVGGIGRFDFLDFDKE